MESKETRGNPRSSNEDVSSGRKQRIKNRSNIRDKIDKKLEQKHLMCMVFSILENRGKITWKIEGRASLLTHGI
jgi:hypothetical protein